MTTTAIPALQYNAIGEPVAADQDAYVRALMAGVQTFPNGVLNQAAPLGRFTPQIDEQSGDFAGIDPANLSADTLAELATFGVTPVGKAWQYSSGANQHLNDPPPVAAAAPAGTSTSNDAAESGDAKPADPAQDHVGESTASAPTTGSAAPSGGPVEGDAATIEKKPDAPTALELSTAEHVAAHSFLDVLVGEEHKLSELARAALLKIRALLRHL